MKYLCILLAFFSCAFADDSNVGNQKPYIEQIISNEQGVFLLVNDFWLCADAFQTTGSYSFVLMNGEWQELADAIESGECRLSYWKCKNCKRYNLEGISACAYCGKPRYG